MIACERNLVLRYDVTTYICSVAIALATYFGISCLPISTVLGSDQFERDDVLETIVDTRRALASFRVECHITRYVAVGYLTDGSNKEVEEKSVVTYYEDDSGRIRMEASVGPTSEWAASTRAAAYDGNVVRKMRGTDEFFFHGRTVTSRAEVFYSGINPRNFITDARNEPIPQMLRRRNGRVVGWERWHGRDLLLLQPESLHRDTSEFPSDLDTEWTRRILVDPERGFSVGKIAQAIRFLPEGEWIEYSYVGVKEAVQHTTGIWLPKRAVAKSGGAPVRPDVNIRYFNRTYIDFRNWEVNPDLPDYLFALEYEPGIIVDDVVTGRTYKAERITDQQIADHAEYARTVEPTGESNKRMVMGSAIATIVLLGVALVALWCFRKRYAHRG